MANHKGSPRTSERPRAAIYARVSSKQQAEANTIASQIRGPEGARPGRRLAAWRPNCASSTKATAAAHFSARLWNAFATRPRLAPSTVVCPLARSALP